MPAENEAREQADFEADRAEQDAFEARFPPEAFREIVLALGGNGDRLSPEALREWLLRDFYFFYSSCAAADKRSRDAQRRRLEERSKAAAALHKSLKRGSWLSQPQELRTEPFRTKFTAVLKELKDSASITRERHRPNEAFRSDLVLGLIWVYEHITGEKAKKPSWSADGGGYGGQFYRFACAVRGCLYDRLPEVRAALPATDGALAQELKNHWPKGDKRTG